MSAYRDDLEAAQLRASDLERELTELRERNRRLEIELAGGDAAREQPVTEDRADRWTLEATRRGRLAVALGVALVGSWGVIAAVADHESGASVAWGIIWGVTLCVIVALRRVDPRPRPSDGGGAGAGARR